MQILSDLTETLSPILKSGGGVRCLLAEMEYCFCALDMCVMFYSDSKNPFHTNPKCSVRGALPYSMGILLSLGRVIHSTYPWIQDCSLGHVIGPQGVEI